MTPKKINGKPEDPSTSIKDYDIPTALKPEIHERLAKFEDLCVKQWG